MKRTPEIDRLVREAEANGAKVLTTAPALSPAAPAPSKAPKAARKSAPPKSPREKVARHRSWTNPAAPGPVAILAFDAASQHVGYAAITARLSPVAFGLISRLDPDEDARVGRLIDAILAACRDAGPAPVACEITKGLQYRFRARSTDLATLARAQGRIAQAIADSGRQVHCVLDTTWTKSITKPNRAARTRLMFPQYAAWADSGEDPGLDVADALGLAVYWLANNKP